ncbi:hypothetical protein F7725_000170 [Dissostichus mawsoni]|uniref:Uncharacterized protein n=1 Tax=Dissostichus mawsoni TaxID=36200 RepID=A0A7J5ZDL6_DISMA|nr:hypothetical protein F7725_000170 [Dissostichus mawsoni]
MSPVPASRVSMMNSAGSKVLASLRPGPLTRTRLASPISDWQGSSRPEGVVREAVSWLRSNSPMSRGMSAAEPTFRWDILMESSPEDSRMETLRGEDAVVSRQDGQVGHGAGPVLVVKTTDVCLGRTLDGQRQTACIDMI